VDNPPSIMPEDHETVKQSEAHCRDQEEVDHRDLTDVVLEQRSRGATIERYRGYFLDLSLIHISEPTRPY